MTAPVIDLSIERGKTFEYAFLYAEDDLIYRPITAIASTAPLRLTVPSHGLPDGWVVDIAGVRAPLELNTGEDGPRFVRVVDANTLELNALDATLWRAFGGTGNVVANKPSDLTGWSARAAVRDRVGGTLLYSWHSDPLQAADGAITVDTARSCFVLVIAATVTAALPWSKGVWEMEAIAPDGKVYPVVAISKIAVSGEVVI